MSSEVLDAVRTGLASPSLGIDITLATFIGIAWYNVLELVFLIFTTFEQFKGLYFWSMLVAAVFGVLPHSVGYLLLDFNLTSAEWLSITLISVGWWFMVTGQSIVLYSRLHIVLWNPRVLRFILFMIGINVIILHVPVTILTYVVAFTSNRTAIECYKAYEKIQIIGFSIQEIIISSLYIRETRNLLKLNPEGGNRKIVIQLFIINIVFILMDVTLIVLEFVRGHTIQTTFKAMAYSIKLKLEFAVLGKLVFIVSRHSWKPESSENNLPTSNIPSNNLHSSAETSDFVDPSRLRGDVTHATSSATSNDNNAQRRNTRQHDRLSYNPHRRRLMDDINIARFEHSGGMLDESPPSTPPEHQSRPNTPPASEAGQNQSPPHTHLASGAGPHQSPPNTPPTSVAGPHLSPHGTLPAFQTRQHLSPSETSPTSGAGPHQSPPDTSPAFGAEQHQNPPETRRASVAYPQQSPPEAPP